MAEEEIEREIERSDLFEENVRLAIANIDNGLSTIPVVVWQSVQPSVSGSMLMEVTPGVNSRLQELQW